MSCTSGFATLAQGYEFGFAYGTEREGVDSFTEPDFFTAYFRCIQLQYVLAEAA
jgi:hypothetical protein